MPNLPFRRALLIACLLITGASSFSARAQEHTDSIIIERIDVQGNKRIEAETVRAYMTLRVGDIYSSTNANASLKRLYATGLFSDVSILQERSQVLVKVEENPIINIIAFEGNDSIDDEELQKGLTIFPRSVYSRSKIIAARQAILKQYKRLGRFSALVEAKIIRLPQNRVNLVFEVQEGEKTGIRDIVFLGNEAFTDSELLGEIASSIQAWWKLLSVSDGYDPDRLDLDAELLRRFYTRRGYADFRVLSAVTELARNRQGFFITFVVEEGEIYRYGETLFEIRSDDFTESDFLRDQLYESGEIYDVYDVRNTLEAMTRRAQELGFVNISIDPIFDRDTENGILNITWQIAHGPRNYIERIDIRGNSFTKDEVIRREMRLEEGDSFDRAKNARTERGLRGLGFFRNVALRPQQGSEKDKVVLEVLVEEFPSGEVSLGAGYSTVDGLVGDFTIRENNFLGNGQTLEFQVARSNLRTITDLNFVEPYFLNRRVRSNIEIYYLDRNYQSTSGYDLRRLSTTVGLRFNIGEDIYLGTSYSFRYDDVYDVSSNASRAVQEVRGTSNRSIISYYTTIDRRDDLRVTTDGWYASFGNDIAGIGGDISFIRTQGDFRLYNKVYESPTTNYVLATRLRLGHIRGWDGDDILINDRYYLGGRAFRGFEYARMGAREIQNGSLSSALGSEFYVIASGEIRLGANTLEAFGLRPVIFSELGYIRGNDEGRPCPTSGIRINCVDDGTGIRMSLGLTLQWESPIGRLQFDFSEALISERYDREEDFRFSIGVPFF